MINKSKERKAIPLRLLYSGSVILAAVTPAAALAQSETLANEQESVGIAPIIVTAERRETALQDTPISISAFSVDDLQSRQINSLSDFGTSVPNLSFHNANSNSGSSNVASAYIRGIGQSNIIINTDPGVGIYVDGVYLSKTLGSVLDVFDLERVEVLRGPQGTLFGRNTIGGAINITTRRPGGSRRAAMEIGLGITQDEVLYRGRASFDMPLADSVSLGGAFYVAQQDGWMETPFNDHPLGDTNRLAGRFQLAIDPVENLTIDLSFDASRTRENGAPVSIVRVDDSSGFIAFLNNSSVGSPCFPPPASSSDARCFSDRWVSGRNINFENDRSFSHADGWGVGANIHWQGNDISIRSITAFRSVDARYGKGLDGSPLPLLNYRSDYDLDQFSQELQLGGTLFDSVDYVLGAYYGHETGGEDYPLELYVNDVLSGGRISNDNWALYGQATWNIIGGLDLVGGLRYTEETKRFTPNQVVTGPGVIGLLPVGTPILPSGEATLSISEISPLIGLSYEWSDEVMTYIRYSEGFKSGGFTQTVFPPLSFIPSFRPEFVSVYEAGIKTESFDRRLIINAAIFQTDYEDVQVLVFQGIAPTTSNAAAARIRGAELEASALIDRNLRVSAGIGYLDAGFIEVGPDASEITIDAQLQNAPEWSINAAVDYTYDRLSWADIRFHADWNYTSTVFNDARNTPEIMQPGYSIVNAGVTISSKDEDLEIVFGVTNIFDTQYFISGYNHLEFIGYVEAAWGEPRTATMTVRTRF
ncbi:TonB-dependent receptor [Parasphingopyxis algicola]|uniref:TonB-dependent receptor n=1 Tax=Parasphingopyxis algicola TaxID=2026624 RepID=UPI0015A17AF4|nr:TonB-dependent receptor [Parasphingopyxis algicola]QLC25079.1 TonB-dependent receptor [Parasphingopyxis algicola]